MTATQEDYRMAWEIRPGDFFCNDNSNVWKVLAYHPDNDIGVFDTVTVLRAWSAGKPVMPRPGNDETFTFSRFSAVFNPSNLIDS